jgi:hypothetical protein
MFEPLSLAGWQSLQAQAAGLAGRHAVLMFALCDGTMAAAPLADLRWQDEMLAIALPYGSRWESFSLPRHALAGGQVVLCSQDPLQVWGPAMASALEDLLYRHGFAGVSRPVAHAFSVANPVTFGEMQFLSRTLLYADWEALTTYFLEQSSDHADAPAQPDLAYQAAHGTELREKMVRSFDVEELSTLCQDLEIASSNFPPTLEPFARELVEYCKRRGKLASLLGACRRQRPNVLWDGNLGLSAGPDQALNSAPERGLAAELWVRLSQAPSVWPTSWPAEQYLVLDAFVTCLVGPAGELVAADNTPSSTTGDRWVMVLWSQTRPAAQDKAYLVERSLAAALRLEAVAFPPLLQWERISNPLRILAAIIHGDVCIGSVRRDWYLQTMAVAILP